MEAQQGMPFKAQPLTLVAYRVRCERIADLRDPQGFAAAALAAEMIACPWELLAADEETPPTWDLARRLMEEGHQGVSVPSFAPGTGAEDHNLVLWRWSDAPPCRIQVIDDFGHLPRDDASWR